MLRSCMHIAEQPLKRSGAQCRCSCCFVRKHRHVVRSRCHLRHGETNESLLPYGRFLSGIEYLLKFGPRFVNKGVAGAIGALGLRVLFQKTFALGLRTCATTASLDILRKFVEDAAPDAASPG